MNALLDMQLVTAFEALKLGFADAAKNLRVARTSKARFQSRP